MINQCYTNILNIQEHYQKTPKLFNHHLINTINLYSILIINNQFNLQELVYILYGILKSTTLLRIEIVYYQIGILAGFLIFNRHSKLFYLIILHCLFYNRNVIFVGHSILFLFIFQLLLKYHFHFIHLF